MKIKEARQAAGLTQQEMSVRFGIPKRTIENWEAEVRTPPEYIEKLLIKELGIKKETGMLSNRKIEEKIKELKEQKTNKIEWTEEIPRTDNPLADGVLEGNFTPDHRFMLEQRSERFYKLYKYNDDLQIFESILVWEDA